MPGFVRRLFCIAALAAITASAAIAQPSPQQTPWPTRPIKLIVPTGPGVREPQNRRAVIDINP